MYILYVNYFMQVVDVLVQVPVKIYRVIHLNIRSIRNEKEGIVLLSLVSDFDMKLILNHDLSFDGLTLFFGIVFGKGYLCIILS